MKKQTANKQPAIVQLVAHYGGPGRVAKILGGVVLRQQVEQWVSRGWCSANYFKALEAFLLPGMTWHDLHNDRAKAKKAVKA